jgi:hypothetical protein
VLGGTRFEAPVRIESDVLDYLDSLVVMEPSHQPYNVLGARALGEAFPGLPQVACFDSSFHRTMPEVAQIYAFSLSRCYRPTVGDGRWRGTYRRRLPLRTASPSPRLEQPEQPDLGRGPWRQAGKQRCAKANRAATVSAHH